MGLLAMRFLTQHPSLMDTGGKLMRKVVPIVPQALTQHSAWSRPGRDLPQMPAQSFKEMWQARQKDKP
jgi:L-lactate dehydrogenase complex protein LldF